ncbi:DUF721 domain-containing protein [uncultured Prochlorococcus sp.]|uniref:DUF721 domain-containing protein n=1 Tax=uncultured Prochlorococcus sp. TaxID=159733 RepID=UPI002590EF42|nr:DUF721 domain-containing protein [uncultured Prochlorococcus sp.]
MNRRKAHLLRNCLDSFKKSLVDFDKLSKINENWKELIGSELFEECKPLNIEKKILTIAVNHPQWRQALIYNKHKLQERIEKIGIILNEIKIIQNYELTNENIKASNAKIVWAKHPSRIHQNSMSICTICNSPTPEGEIKRWGKCSFCWRKIKK